MPCKATFFFHLANQGWTETFYFNTESVPDTVRSANLLAGPSCGLRSPSAILDFIRITHLGSRGDTALIPRNQKGTYAPASTPDVTSTAALCTAYSGIGRRRPVLLRGLDDKAVERDPNGVSTPSGPLTVALAFFKSALQAQTACIQYYDRVGLLPATEVAQLSVDPANAANTIVETAGAHGIADHTLSTFRKIPNPPLGLLKGNWLIRAIDLDHFSIPYRLETPSPFKPAHMTVQAFQTNLAPITDLVFFRFNTRKTGRPFVPSRGRVKGATARR